MCTGTCMQCHTHGGQRISWRELAVSSTIQVPGVKSGGRTWQQVSLGTEESHLARGLSIFLSF